MNKIDSLSLINITFFLETSCNINLLHSCKKINKVLTKYGFVTDLRLNYDRSYYEKIKKLKGKPQSIQLLGFSNPLEWLPFHPTKIILIDCDEQYENIIVFCLSNNYEIVTQNDNLVSLIKSPDQPLLQDI